MPPPPLDQAKGLYDSHGACFEADLAHYLRFGYVFSTPEHFLMAAPVTLPDIAHLARPGEADAWYVRLAVGHGAMRWFIRQMPWSLPFVCWNRAFKNPKGALHVWPSQRLLRCL